MALFNIGAMLAAGHYAVIYGNIGRTVWSSDGEAHVFVGGGLKILIAPDRNR